MELKKQEHLEILNGSEPTVETDGVVVPMKVAAPFAGSVEFIGAKLKDAIVVTADMLEIEPRQPGKWQENFIRIKVGDTVTRINLYGKMIVLSDDNYIVITGKRQRFLLENTLTNKLSDVLVSCVGSHGGKNNACDTCIHNRETDPEGYRPVYIATMACELSKHYFGNKPYWFQQRIEVKQLH